MGPQARSHSTISSQHTAEAECVIASRWVPGAILHQSQSGKRQFASRVFHGIVQALFWMNIKDTQCGAKVMRREAVQSIHSSLRITDMAFDLNLLYALKRNGFKVLEVPTEWTDQAGSKVVLGKTSISMLLSALRLRLVYSPFHRLLGFLRPLEMLIYAKLSRQRPAAEKRELSGCGRCRSLLASPGKDDAHQEEQDGKNSEGLNDFQVSGGKPFV